MRMRTLTWGAAKLAAASALAVYMLGSRGFATTSAEQNVLFTHPHHQHHPLSHTGLHEITVSANTQVDDDLSEENNVFLVIGVKTSVLRGSHARHAIRQTWGDPVNTNTRDVRLLFLGCSPDLSMLSEVDRLRAELDITEEKATFNDLLTDELRCHDSFYTLVDKTVAFLDHAFSRFPSLAFAMVADDDIYLRVDQLVTLLHSNAIPKTRFYGGNTALAEQYKPSMPSLNPTNRYYLPHHAYPLPELPPFLSGAHYILSRDIVRFVVRNRDDLRGLQGLDDATMGVWLLALQVHPVYLPQFQVVRSWNCSSNDFDGLISYADLSIPALHRIHANVISNRSFCHGYDYEAWSKVYRTIRLPGLDMNATTHDGGGSSEIKQPANRFHWDLQLNATSGAFQVAMVFSVAGQNVSLTYVPSSGMYTTAFCHRFLPLLEAKLHLVVTQEYCAYHRILLQNFLTNVHASTPTMRPTLELARHNLERAGSQISDTLFVGLLLGTDHRFARVIVECLLVQMYPTQHIAILDEEQLQKQQPPAMVFIVPSSDEQSIKTQLTKVQPSVSVVVVVSANVRPLLRLPEMQKPLVVISSDSRGPLHTAATNHLYLPLASAIFGTSMRHSPLELLHSVRPEEFDRPSFGGFYCEQRHYQSDQQLQLVDLLSHHERLAPLGRCDEQRPPSSPHRFHTMPLDVAIEQTRPFQFMVAFEDNENGDIPPGSVSDKIVTAFLAGSIPIYCGHSHSVSWLFNPRAFIDCGTFESLRGCADHVLQVHKTPSLYEAMRSEPPVVNETAFMEVFSWHPDVADMAKKTQQTHGKQLLMSDQLKRLIDSEQAAPLM